MKEIYKKSFLLPQKTPLLNIQVVFLLWYHKNHSCFFTLMSYQFLEILIELQDFHRKKSFHKANFFSSKILISVQPILQHHQFLIEFAPLYLYLLW